MSYRSLAQALLLGKPYFGPALSAMQGIPERHGYFLPVIANLASTRAAAPLAILEIGSWAGASAITWASALRETGAPGQVTCVDAWDPYFDLSKDGSAHYEEMNAAAEGRLIERLFEHNIRAAGVAERIEVRRGTSREILPAFPSGSFDVIYIDGSHRFEDVRFDIGEAKRLLRDGGTICGDDLELQAGAVPDGELRQAIAGGSDYVYSEAAQAHYHPGVTGAVAAEFEAVAVWNGFWAVRRRGGDWIPVELDLTRLRLPAHILAAHDASVRLAGSTDTYNLLQAGGRFFAVAKSLGELDLLHERLGDRELPPLLLTGESLEQVRQKCGSAGPVGPVLMGDCGEFNLVSYNGRAYGLRRALGPVDPTIGNAELERRYGADNVIFGDTVEVVRARIELAELRAALEAERTERAREVAVLRNRLEASVAEIRDPLTRVETRNEAIQEQTALSVRMLLERSASVEEIQAALAHLRDSAAKIAQRLQAAESRLTLAEYGPGNPDTPCPAGEHRGFSLVHYQGRVYALRKPLPVDDARLGESELLARHGADNVIAGASLDGVRARVDVLEEIRDVRADVAAVEREILVQHAQGAADLRLVKSAVQSHSRDLDSLAHSRLSRLLRLLSREQK